MTVIANTTKTILISVDLSELRVAVLEEGRTVETYIERRGAGSSPATSTRHKIDNILPAIEAAFVDFGAPKNGFLQVRDVVVPGVSATARRRKKISDDAARSRPGRPGADREEPDEAPRARA